MDIELLKTRYLKVIKKCATIAGIWPEQSLKSKVVSRIITYILAICAASTQIARIVCFFSLDTLLEQMPFLTATFGALVKQGNYIVYAKEYENLMTGITRDWLTHRFKAEMDIMMLYAERAYLFILIYLATAISCLVLFLQMPLTPRILDIVWPKNESRDLGYVYPAYYAIDEHKYHPYIILHMTVGIIMLTYVFIACDTSFMYTVQHSCGLMAVSGYRFKTAMGELFNTKDKFSHDEIYRNVCNSIRGQQHALGYLKTVQNAHNAYLFMAVGMSMVCFSATLVKVSNMSMCIELAKDYTFIVVQLVHLLYLSIQGQFVTNSTDQLFESISEMLWYNGNKRSQRLVVLALRNSIAPPILSAGGLITLNLQTFAEILKASVSYFTVLKST